MNEKLYEIMADYLEIVMQLEEIERCIILQKIGITEYTEIKRRDVEAILNTEVRLLSMVIREAYQIHKEIDKFILDME